jgi:Ca2+-dependent lipid-binding protein
LSDPFVMVFDSMNDSKAPPIGMTQVVDDSLEPSWDEAFYVKIDEVEAFVKRKFRFEVYDYDLIGDNEFLGASTFFFFFFYYL